MTKRRFMMLSRFRFLVMLGLMIVPVRGLALNDEQNSLFNKGIYFYEPSDNPCDIQTASANPGPVYVVGDSLTEGMSQNGLSQSLTDSGWQPTVNFSSGRSVNDGGDKKQSGIKAVEDDSSAVAQAKTVVVELGTNPGDTDPTIASEVESMVDAIHAINTTASIYWVNIGSVVNTDYGNRNQVIAQDAAKKGFKVINWFNEVFPGGDPYNIDTSLKSKNGWLDGGGGIHPNADGYKAMINLVVDAITKGLVGAPGGGALPPVVPAPYNAIFTAAAKAENSIPAVVAALFSEEHFTHSDPQSLPSIKWPDPNGPWNTSGANAQGPFQFLPTTWEIYKQDGNGDGNQDIQNLSDAAFGAAKMMSSNGAKAGANNAAVMAAIHTYNSRSTFYTQEAMAFYLYYLDGSSPISTTGTDSCGGAQQLGVSPDGFVFPQVTTKSQLAAQTPYHWNPDCVNPVPEMGPGSTLPGSDPSSDRKDLCHHDYLAADIFNATGTPVVAVRPGRIISAHDNGKYGYTVRWYSDPKLGGDGLWYYMAHMLQSTEGGKVFVNDNDPVTAGQQVGVVGTDADAEGTEHHTHIDISPIENGFTRSYSGTEGPLLDPMPALKGAWERLPQ